MGLPRVLRSVLVAESCPTLVTPWTVAHQAPLSMGFPRQEYWSGLPFPSPGGSYQPGDQTHICFAGGFFTAELRQCLVLTTSCTDMTVAGALGHNHIRSLARALSTAYRVAATLDVCQPGPSFVTLPL